MVMKGIGVWTMGTVLSICYIHLHTAGIEMYYYKSDFFLTVDLLLIDNVIARMEQVTRACMFCKS